LIPFEIKIKEKTKKDLKGTYPVSTNFTSPEKPYILDFPA